jgi:UDPglucose 6-dehydrogenase
MAGRSVAVVGCGHVGLVMAAGLARLGHRVVGVDRNPELLARLDQALVPFHEPGLPELVAEGIAEGRLSFTTSYAEAVPQAEFIFLAVDTPGTLAGAADLRNIRAATRSIAEVLDGKAPIIVNKSTSPIGTGETIEGILHRALGGRSGPPRIVSNPEFLQQGRAVRDFFEPDRIVIGARIEQDARAVAQLYAGLPGELVLTDLRTAEMIKYVANSFLGTRLSFVNEIARLCEALSVDVDEVMSGIALDPRIGRHFLRPGIGFGGSCLPKDIAALRYMGEALGVGTPILSAVQQVNQGQRTSAVRKLRGLLGTLDGATIGVWGLTFKGETEDVRESPAVDVIGLLLNEGADVRVYDPSFPEALAPRLQDLVVDSPIEAARAADALAVLTEWPAFREVSLSEVARAMRGTILFDGRNVIDRDAALAAGFTYVGVGRGRPAPMPVIVSEAVPRPVESIA